MTIKIKKSVKPIKYEFAINKLEDILEQIKKNEGNELIWILEHEEIYTGGTSFKSNEILDKSINFLKTNRGGKITYHGPGQIVFSFVLDCLCGMLVVKLWTFLPRESCIWRNEGCCNLSCCSILFWAALQTLIDTDQTVQRRER